MDDELAGDVIERAQHCHLLGLSWRRHAQVRAGLRPRPGEIGVRRRLALVAVKQNDVAGFGLTLADLRRKPIRSTSLAVWRPFSVCRGRRQRNFFGNASDKL